MNAKQQDKFILKSLTGGSSNHGNCEVCGGVADPIYWQLKKREYTRTLTGEPAWITIQETVGHLNCLEQVRREPFEIA
jgi:hypothetical protein